MKIRADEHVAPKIVKALVLLVLPSEWEMTHVRDFHAPRTADETWIPLFAAQGGNVILSADRKILARPHQLAAIAQGNLIGVFLSPQWAEARRNVQAAAILWWWPKIEKTVRNAVPKQCFRVPPGFGAGELEPLRINFEKAADSRR